MSIALPLPEGLGAVLSVDPARLEGTLALDYVRDIERLIAHLDSRQAQALVAVASPRRTVDEYVLWGARSDEERVIRIEDAAREEVASALRWSLPAAQNKIDIARLLHGPLAATREALAAGEIVGSHVAVIAEHARRLPGALQSTAFAGPLADPGADAEFTAACMDLQRRVLPTAVRSTAAATRQAARRAVLAIDAEGERRRRLQARCHRDVHVVDELDGISVLIARMATEDAHAVMKQLDDVAHGSDSNVTIGEKRTEALAALVLGGDGATAAPVRAHVDVVIDLPTLLGLAEGPAGSAEIRGAGPVSADVVRDLLADPNVAVTMRRLVTDPVTGHLLDYGRRTYEIPDPLRRYLVARDRTCRFPGCNRRAEKCQLDHATAWDDGGQTNPQNLGALCQRHHQLKTHAGWHITDSESDGSCTWHSPRGRRYDHNPPPL